MIDKYIAPNFDNLKPVKIIRANENIKKSKYYDPAVELKPTKDRFRYRAARSTPWPSRA